MSSCCTSEQIGLMITLQQIVFNDQKIRSSSTHQRTGNAKAKKPPCYKNFINSNNNVQNKVDINFSSRQSPRNQALLQNLLGKNDQHVRLSHDSEKPGGLKLNLKLVNANRCSTQMKSRSSQ